jgi:hypothetical protein
MESTALGTLRVMKYDSKGTGHWSKVTRSKNPNVLKPRPESMIAMGAF